MTQLEAASVVPYNAYSDIFAIAYFTGKQMEFLTGRGGWTHDRRCALRWRDKAAAEQALDMARAVERMAKP